MNLLESIASSPGALSQLGQSVGLSEGQTQSALKALLPALSSGLKKNTAQPSGLEGLLSALNQGGHAKYLEKPEQLSAAGAIAEDNGILGHLLGNKETSRRVAQRASQQTGISDGVLKQMLPLVATMVMGALSKQSAPVRAQASSGAGGDLFGMLAPMLDADGDGSVADDLLGMAGKFFR
ncbi:MAG: DUF937 domain-containing protein [Acidobacteria bacterium]|nr:DUF937 domain-containing protein [Acidobacteriota bacterium]